MLKHSRSRQCSEHLHNDLKKQDLKKYPTKSKFGHGTKSSKKKVACAE